ncbi:transmembrane domain-containing protein [Cryptosporidium canis]|nr:transmembrane domain-containing protein [Cryptosporidium canis]
MYFQRQEVLGAPPILASIGSIFSNDSKKDKLSPTYQLFVGIGYIFYLIIFMIVITKVIQPNEEYSSIYSIQNILKSANWNPDLSTPKNSMFNSIQTNTDIQYWMYYVLGPPLLNGHIADQNQFIGASLTKCVGEYLESDIEKNYVPSDYGIVKVINLNNCNKTKLNLVSRIASPYKYLEAFFDSSENYIVQEIEKSPELPALPKLSNRTDVISYSAELLFYNGNIDTYSVISFSFNLSIFGTFIVEVLSQSASPIKKYIGFPCTGACNLNINQIIKSAIFFIYCVIFILHLLSGVLLLISNLSGSPSYSQNEYERNGLGIESWSSYFKERSLSISIRISHLSVILLWISSAVIVQLLPTQSLNTILEKSNQAAKIINMGQTSETPLLNHIIYTIQIASVIKFTGTVIACIASFLMLFRIFQIFSSLFSQINVPLKTITLYFKKIVGLFFLINMLVLTMALGIIVYLHIDKLSANIQGMNTSISSSVFSLLLAPFSSGLSEGAPERVNQIPSIIFFSIVLGISILYLLLIPMSTATIMFIYNEVEILQSLRQNTDNIYTIKTTLSAWVQQLFFLSTFWQSKKVSIFSSPSNDKEMKIAHDTQNEIEAQSHQENNSKEIIINEETNGIDKFNENSLNQMIQQKMKQLKKFFELPPRLEYIPYHLFLLIILFSFVSIYWIVSVVNYQLYTETGDVIWKILDSPFRARSFYTFDPTLDFFPYMFKSCNNKNESPNFLYNKNQLPNIPEELLYGLYQSYKLTNITSLSHIKAWIQKIFIPLIKTKNVQSSGGKDFLIDLGHPTFDSTINPMLLFKQHFSPVKCNSNPISSELYLSTISKSKSSLSIKDISNFNTSSVSKVPKSLSRSSKSGLLNISNIFSRFLNFMNRGGGSVNRKLNASLDNNYQLESLLSSSGVDRVFFLYAGNESEISQQFDKSLNGSDKGNLFWVLKSYSLSTRSEVSVDFIPSLNIFDLNEDVNVPFDGLFDYNMDNLEIYLPIIIPNQLSASLLTLKFEVLRTGKIEIEYVFDFVKREWITQVIGENDSIDSHIQEKSNNSSQNEIQSNELNINSNTWLFPSIMIGVQGFIILLFILLATYNFHRKRFLSKRLIHQINYKMDISESDSENEIPKKKKIRRIGIRKFEKKIKRKEIENDQSKIKGQKLESSGNRNLYLNEKKNVLEFRKKNPKRKQDQEFKEEIIEYKHLEEEIYDEDVLSLYKLSNLNIMIIIIMSIIFFILFSLSIAYYILITSTKISMNLNSIDIEGGFNSIASSHGNALPWEIDQSNLNIDSKLNMIGSSSGFYNDHIFSFKNLFEAINNIQEISKYFEHFEIIGVLLIITYLSIIFVYSSLLVDRHRRTKMLRMKRYLEKTGRKLQGNSFESLSVFTFMDTTSQRGFSWNDANYALIPILCVVISFILIFSLTGYSILGYQETTYFSYYYSVLSSLLIIFNYNSVKQVIMTSITPDISIRFKSNFLTFFWRPIYYLLTFFTFNFILKALIPASIIFYMRSVASRNLQISQDTLLSKLNNVAVTRPSIPIFMNDSISLRMKFFIKALYKKLGKFKNFDMNLMKGSSMEEHTDRDVHLTGENPDWIFAKLIPELFNEIIHYKLNVAELVNKDQQGIQEIRDYLGNISLQLLLIQEHLVKIEFLRCKLSMIRQELMKIEDVKKDISRGNRESQHYIDRLLQRLMSINDEIEHLDESNRVLGQEKESAKQKTTNASANYSLQKEKEKFSTDFLFEYGNSYAKTLFENSKINDITSSDENSDGSSYSQRYPDEANSTVFKNKNTKKSIINYIHENKKGDNIVQNIWKRD